MADPGKSESFQEDAQARLAAIVESSDDAIIGKNLQGIIQSWNQGAERIFGYRAEEVIGKPLTILFPTDRLQEEPEILKRIGQGERVDHFETVRRVKDGSLIDVSVTISPIRDSAGRVVGASKIARDITEQKRVQRELKEAKAAADAANRARDRFLSNLSHELRTPLTPVLAAITFIESQPELPAAFREQLRMMRRNVETEARLVDDLMDMTRLTRGELELDLETIDAHAAIHDVLAMFQTQIDFHKLHVTVALSAGRNLVRADAGRFQQVLMHMMSNAVKFTPDYGAIALRSFNVQDRMNIEISDTGVGIDTQELPRLFNAFEQEEEAINRRFGGLGLGLTIVKALVEMHRGRIAVMSAGRDRGSTFTLDLPTVASPVTQTPQGNTSRKTAYRILLVEDHADTRQALMVLLRSFGCVVSTAATVKEAVEMGDREDFDLLVSDIGLPDGSGIDVMRYMREHHHVKGIAMSGFGQDEDLRRSREAGFAAHLIKPISFQNLQETIQRVAG